MRPDDSFRVIPQDIADTVVAVLVACVLLFGAIPEIALWLRSL